jgi:urease accessory protein
MKKNLTRYAIALAALAFCGIANAHPGHGSGFEAGVAHPLLGLDHLLAMIAVGVWAAQLGGRARWMVPASFVSIMAIAGGIGMSGIVTLPLVEGGIATSVLLLGLLIAFSINVTPAVGAVIVGLFAVFHGYAHGTEMPMMSSSLMYGLGFVVSTACLHGLGLLAGARLHKQATWVRAVGVAVAASGAWMIATI